MHLYDCLHFTRRILVLSICLFLLPAQLHAQEQVTRVWTVGKFKREMILLSHDKEKVKLKNLKGKQEVVDLKIGALSKQDRDFLAGLKIIEDDRLQYETVMPHMARFTESPMAVLAILEQVAKDHKNSPYAKMMAGLAQATENANYRGAKKNFEGAVKIINKHQQVLGEGFHAKTLIALENNIGVCALKMSKGDEASKHFTAGSKGIVPFALYHNATLLMEATSGRSQIKFTNKWRGELVKILAKKKPADPGVEVPSMYLFSLEWDEPLRSNQLSKLVSLGGQPLPDSDSKSNYVGGAVFESERELKKRGFNEHAAASGVMISPKLLLTNRHIVQSKDSDLSYTLTQFSDESRPTLVGGKIVKWSIVHEQDLALVELDQPMEQFVPVTLRQRRLRQNEELAVLGYPKIFTRGEHITATMGRFLEEDAERSWIFTTNLMDDGVGGGPCLDMNGNLVGLAFAKDDFRAGRFLWFQNMNVERRHYDHAVVVSTGAISDFMKIAAPEFQFKNEAANRFESHQQMAEAVKNSVMLVKSWKAAKNNVHEVRPDFVPQGSREAYDFKRKKAGIELASIRRKRLFPDLWCMTCYGRGKLHCLTCGGEGKVFSRVSVYTGNRNAAGQKIYKHEVKGKTCPGCKGRPFKDCPHCVEGQLRLE